jgi:hypothetical protein
METKPPSYRNILLGIILGILIYSFGASFTYHYYLSRNSTESMASTNAGFCGVLWPVALPMIAASDINEELFR